MAVIPPAAIRRRAGFSATQGQTAKSAAAEHAQTDRQRQRDNQNRPTVQRSRDTMRTPEAAMVPNITSVGRPEPVLEYVVQNRSLPGTDQHDQHQRDDKTDIAAGNTGYWITPLFCPKQEFGKVLNTAEQTSSGRLPARRLSGVSCTATGHWLFGNVRGRRDIANGFHEVIIKTSISGSSRLHSMPRRNRAALAP